MGLPVLLNPTTMDDLSKHFCVGPDDAQAAPHVSLSPIYISSLTVMEGTFKSETLRQGEAKPM